MPKSRISTFEIHYDAVGEGEPLILIPGFASGAWSWSWQTRDLAREFKVVTFDPRGIGQSRVDHGTGVSIPLIADDVIALLDELTIDSAHVLGISFGGFVAQDLALRYPGRLDRLVLASTSFGGPNHVAPSMQVLAAFASTEDLNTPDRIRKYLTVAFSPEFVEHSPETVEEFCNLREMSFVPRDVYVQQLQSALTFNAEMELHRITNETLVITGDDDVVVPAQNSTNLVAAVPNSRLEVIRGSGHMAFIERAPEFNRSVTDFLQSGIR